MNEIQNKDSKRMFRWWFENADGSTALEYATILGLVGAMLFPAVQVLGRRVNDAHQTTVEALLDSPEPPTAPGGQGQIR